MTQRRAARILIAFAALLAVDGGRFASGQEADPVFGAWTLGDDVLVVAPCGASACGALRAKSDLQPCERHALGAFTRVAPGVWTDGFAQRTDGGRRWPAEMRVDEDGALVLRRHLGVPVLGRDEVWRRADAPPPPCEP